MATRDIFTAREANVGHPAAPTVDPSIYDIIAQTFANQLQNSTSQKDLESIMSALTGSAGLPSNAISPDSLFGMTPDQVIKVATDRTNSNAQNMLSAVTGAKAIQDLKGVPDARALNNKLVEGEQKRQMELELADFSKNAQMHVARAAGESNQNPFMLRAFKAYEDMQAGKEVSDTDRVLMKSFIKSPADTLAEAAMKDNTNLIYLYPGDDNIAVRAQKKRENDAIIDEWRKGAFDKPDLPKKRSGSIAMEIPSTQIHTESSVRTQLKAAGKDSTFIDNYIKRAKEAGKL